MSVSVLADEKAHLHRARSALQQMQDRSVDWQQAAGGDGVSTEYLKQMLYRRMTELADAPDTPLFFGRLDFTTRLGADRDEVCHIGRRHVTSGPGGNPLVIDWRAPVARAFYQARSTDPMGVALRRRFGFHDGELSAYEDEDLTTDISSELLEQEIARPRSGPMRDIVATIQPEQDDLVRAPLEHSLCVQGAPGTGKTAVGLHRAAYLLYTYRKRVANSGILVIGPSDSFLDYIADVLPALGEIDATQQTLETLFGEATGLKIRADDAEPAAVLKGDARLADVLHRAVWSQITMPGESLVVPRGHRNWRVPAHLLSGAVTGLLDRGVRYLAGRALLAKSFAHQVLLRMEVSGEVTDDRLQNTIARSKPVKDAVAEIWPALTAPKVLHRLFSDRDFLASCAAGILDADEQELLLWEKPRRTHGNAPWTPADLVLLDELNDLLDRTPCLAHVIVDEAQDLSAMQLRAVGRRAATGSVTLLGDLAQATTPWATTNWADALGHIGKSDAPIAELVEGFRVPGDVLELAARLLPTIAPSLTPPRAVRRSGGDLRLVEVPDVLAAATAAVESALTAEGTIGVIVEDALADQLSAIAGPRVSIVPASSAKGLEFDHVVLCEPAMIVDSGTSELVGLRLLYVCITRAVSSLTVLHTRDLPAQLLG